MDHWHRYEGEAIVLPQLVISRRQTETPTYKSNQQGRDVEEKIINLSHPELRRLEKVRVQPSQTFYKQSDRPSKRRRQQLAQTAAAFAGQGPTRSFSSTAGPQPGKIQKATSLPALPPLPKLPKLFDAMLKDAKHEVSKKKHAERWSPEAERQRYNETKQHFSTMREDMWARGRAQKSTDMFAWRQRPGGQEIMSASDAWAVSAKPAGTESRKTSTQLSDVQEEEPDNFGEISLSAGGGQDKGAIEGSRPKKLMRSKSSTFGPTSPQEPTGERPKKMTLKRAKTTMLGQSSPQEPAGPPQPLVANSKQPLLAKSKSSPGMLVTIEEKEPQTEEEILCKKLLRQKFEQEWLGCEDAHGFQKEDAMHIFSFYQRVLGEGDYELHKDEIPFIIDYFGFLLHEEEEAVRIADEITDCSTMTFEEFLRFLRGYKKFEQDWCHEQFNHYDRDNSGSISVEELKFVLEDLGYLPTRNVLHEALKAVDVDHSGHIDFEEFQVLWETWRHTEGMTNEEFSEMRELFTQFDSDKDGELSLDDYVRIKRYLGYKEWPVSMFSKGHEMPIGWTRFLSEVRKCREQELQNFREMFRKEDKDGSGKLEWNEIVKVFEDCGLTPLKKRIQECINEVDKGGTGALDFEEFVHVMWLYKKTDGFTEAELVELNELFHRFDKDGSGEIEAIELGDLMRYEGFHPDIDELQQLVDRFDADATGEIGYREFCKIARHLYEAEIRTYRTLFQKHDRDENHKIQTDEIATILEELGREVTSESIHQTLQTFDADGSGALEWEEFVELMESFRQQEVLVKRRMCGFAQKQVEKFYKMFQGYDKDGSDDLDPQEMVQFLADYKLAPRTEKEQVAILSQLQRCRDLAGVKDEKITFLVILQLLRMLEEDQDRGSLIVEKKAAEKANFNADEVREFRAAFTHWYGKLRALSEESETDCGACEDCNALTTEGIARMLRSFGVKMPKISDYEILDTICTKCDINGNGSVDFPDFLGVMRTLLDTNFRDILHITSSYA